MADMKRVLCVCFLFFCVAGVALADDYPLPCGLKFGMHPSEVAHELQGKGFRLSDSGSWTGDMIVVDFGAQCKIVRVKYNDNNQLIGMTVGVYDDFQKCGITFWEYYAHWYDEHDTPVRFMRKTSGAYLLIGFEMTQE